MIMKSPRLSHRVPESLKIGARVSFSRTLTDGDVALFIGATWDVNPYHTDDVFVSMTPFQKRFVPGLLTASLLTHLGGLWAFLATEMNFEFLLPVYIGETITAEAEIFELDELSGGVSLRCRCVNQSGKEVLRAVVKGFPGQFESREK
ncbi:MAG: MaoC family dehydratase [Chloroflexota bacterium]